MTNLQRNRLETALRFILAICVLAVAVEVLVSTAHGRDAGASGDTPMPNPGLNRDEVRQVLKYLHWADQRLAQR